MAVDIAVYPTADQFQNLLGLPDNGPVCMINLLKFKDKAAYEDGRETDLTGAEAYGLYGDPMKRVVEANGGRFLFTASVDTLMIGTGDGDYDAAAIVEYPSRAEFVRIATLPEVADIGVHRAAGLAGQLLIATTQGGDNILSD